VYDNLLIDEEHLPPDACSIEHPPPYFIRLFEHAAQHQQFYQMMLRGDGIGRFQNLIKQYIADVASANVRSLPSANQHLSIPLAMHTQFVAGAALSLLAWWLENDMPLSPHQMAQYLLSPHGMPSSHN
jgi:hypothetical protein